MRGPNLTVSQPSVVPILTQRQTKMNSKVIDKLASQYRYPSIKWLNTFPNAFTSQMAKKYRDN